MVGLQQYVHSRLTVKWINCTHMCSRSLLCVLSFLFWQTSHALRFLLWAPLTRSPVPSLLITCKMAPHLSSLEMSGAARVTSLIKTFLTWVLTCSFQALLTVFGKRQASQALSYATPLWSAAFPLPSFHEVHGHSSLRRLWASHPSLRLYFLFICKIFIEVWFVCNVVLLQV